VPRVIARLLPVSTIDRDTWLWMWASGGFVLGFAVSQTLFVLTRS
jgi:hypothetical protein